MSVDISAVLEGGFEKTVARSGLLLTGVFFAISVLNALFSPELDGVLAEEIPGDVAPGAGDPVTPSLGLSPGVAGILTLLMAIASAVVTLVAIRTFVAGETETIPREYVERNLLWATVNLVIGGIVFSFALIIGLVFLIVPGLFLLVSLFFWAVYVAVEDQSFADGFQSSWGLTRGHRLQLFGLGVVFVLVVFVVSLVISIPSLFLPSILGFLVSTAGNAFITVFTYAATAETYNQLVTLEEEGNEDETLSAGPDEQFG